MVGLAHKTQAFPLELSGGEQQRVAIARAIVGNASTILADEPTAALDSENGHAIMTLLAEIAKDPSRGVLVVTHDPRILPSRIGWFASKTDALSARNGRGKLSKESQDSGGIYDYAET